MQLDQKPRFRFYRCIVLASVPIISLLIVKRRKAAKGEKGIVSSEKVPKKLWKKVKGRKGPKSRRKRTCQLADVSASGHVQYNEVCVYVRKEDAQTKKEMR
jgi:hypothetical protein